MRRLPATVALLAATALLSPATAAGQGAGDEQYRDPFAGQQPENTQPQPQDGSASEPTDASAGTTQEAQASDTSAVPAQASGELPRTGFEGVLLLLGYGWALLVGGATLRRIA